MWCVASAAWARSSAESSIAGTCPSWSWRRDRRPGNVSATPVICFLAGDATQEEVLLAAGIDHAKGLVSVLESDAANLYTVLTGRQLNPKLDITARAGERSAQTKLKMVGADRVINPYVLGGMRLVVGVLKPDVLEFLDAVVDYKEQQIELEQVRIAEGSAYCGRTARRHRDLTGPQIHRAVDQEERRPDDLQSATGYRPRAGRHPDRHRRHRGSERTRLRLRVGSSHRRRCQVKQS